MPNRILIVDDEPDIRAVMRLALEGRDYAIDEAGSGEEVLARLPGTRWDVVLLDQRLPGIDGLQTLKGIRELDRGCTVIMVTAFASIDLAVEAMKLGAGDFVQKPMTPETLRAAVAAALSKVRGEWVAPPVPAGTGSYAWQVWTMNGFHVVDARAPVSPTEHRFELIQGRDGPPHPVTVRVAPGVVAAASEACGRSMDGDGRFWMHQGGLALARYVWSNAGAPPDGRLSIDALTPDMVRDALAGSED